MGKMLRWEEGGGRDVLKTNVSVNDEEADQRAVEERAESAGGEGGDCYWD